MTLWQRSIGRIRAHWKLAWIPLGLSAIVYGNSLYKSSQQRLGMTLFLGGWAIAVCGMSALKRFLDENPLREGNQKVAFLAIFLLLFLGALFSPRPRPYGERPSRVTTALPPHHWA